MSTATLDGYRAVTHLAQQKERMSLLMRARQAARRALDAALAVARNAARYVARLVAGTHLGRFASAVRGTAGRVTRLALAGLGKSGAAAALAAAATSPTVRAVASRVAGWLGRGLGWLARSTYNLVDRGLRMFGRPGNVVADRMFDAAVSVGGKVAEVAAPVVHRVARLSDPKAPHTRLLAAISRSYVLHRVLTSVVPSRLLRLLVEGLLVPTLVDSRLGQWLRGRVSELRTHAQSLASQGEQLAWLDDRARPTVRPGDVAAAVAETAVDGTTGSVVLEGDVLPSNRAERRAKERQEGRRTA